ncbi:hypothetical protein AALP_AA2G037900 [Arabis alpina]|uniref:Uncharacterized protein n=1 Tax=Arabis alpina TaxID=50452 RepID=A0A087HF62_ARAAL|nr:hypothetical protein AALP_AA2G037900 [Arabis alpina]
MIRFNTTSLPSDLVGMYDGVMVPAGASDSNPFPYDFTYEFKGEGKHITQVSIECLRFSWCIQGGAQFLVPFRDELSDRNAILDGYNFVSDAFYPADQRSQKLNIQNGELVDRSNQLLEARCRAEEELANTKKLLEQSHTLNRGLTYQQNSLNLKIQKLTSALARAEEDKREKISQAENHVAQLKSSSEGAVARAVEELVKRVKDKLKPSLWCAEANRKRCKKGDPSRRQEEEELEIRLAGYEEKAEAIDLPALPADSEDEGLEDEESQQNAHEISSEDEEESERSSRWTVGRPLLARLLLSLWLRLNKLRMRVTLRRSKMRPIQLRQLGKLRRMSFEMTKPSRLRLLKRLSLRWSMPLLRSQLLLSSPIPNWTFKTRKTLPRSPVIG